MKNMSLWMKNMISGLLALVLLAMTVLSPAPAIAAVRLDTNNISNFTLLGSQQPVTAPTTISFDDADVSDVSALTAPDPDAAPGGDLDLTVTFQVRSVTPNAADGCFRVTINDGQTKSATAACVIINGHRAIGLFGTGTPSDPAAYPVSVVVEWLGAPVTLKLRRWANGDAELLQINGVAPNPRMLLTSDLVATRSRAGASVDFGCLSLEGLADVDVTQFFTEKPFPTQVIVPVNGVTPTLTPVTINASAGDQFDPHVSGDWVAYTSDIGLRYYNFATNTDAAIPMGSSANDLLSDISGSKVVFSRVTIGAGTAVMVFDAATAAPPIEVDPGSAPTRFGSAIGGNTVAYIDFGLQANGELVIHDLTTSISTRITNDTVGDGNPQVSPDGNVVTWEHCGASLTNCDVWQAVKSGSTWTVSIVSNSVSPEGNPDTNGSLVVYDSHRGSNADIFWRPVGGGAEVQLQLPGFEGNPSIAGTFIAFESRATVIDAADIFVYDIPNNRLYQITNTPLVNEQLNDITVLPDGRIRVVWASDEDGADQRNVRAATFSLPGAADTTPPVITQPADIIANATVPSGAAVGFSVTATDDVGVASLVCMPSAGSVFPIGTTPVHCSASDAAGNIGGASFNVKVKGAAEQIVDLIQLASTRTLPPVLKAKLLAALQTALADPRKVPIACLGLSLFIQLVQSQPASVISPALKAQLIADANRIKSVLGCH